MQLPAIVCPKCGAQVAPPAHPDAVFAGCAHCQFTVPLSAEWVESRQRQQAAIDRRHHEAQERTAEARAKRKQQLVVLFVFGGGVVFVLGLVGVIVGLELWKNQRAEEERTAKAALDERTRAHLVSQLEPILGRLREQGCTREVSPVATVLQRASTELSMRAGGNCWHAVVAARTRIDVRLVGPSGKISTAQGQGTVDFEHCPQETGKHTFSASTEPGGMLAYAMADCAPAFEKHRDDPAKNGLTRAQARLKSLTTAGCRRVILPPRAVTGEQTLTATMHTGAFCSVLVVSAGSDDTVLETTLKSPMGELAATKRSSDMELAHCAKVTGDHAVTVTPTNGDYFTLAGMECPRAVARKRGAK